MSKLLRRIDTRLRPIFENNDNAEAIKRFNATYAAYQEAVREHGSDSSQAKSNLAALKQIQNEIRGAGSSNPTNSAQVEVDQPSRPVDNTDDENVDYNPEDRFAGDVDAKPIQQTTYSGRKRFDNPNYKDPRKGDRQEAEDALYHTVGPLTANPKWVSSEWQNTGNPPPDFVPGGPAPRWTPEQIIFAMAGDPSMLFTGQNNHPLSPQYGNKGGAPLYRKARQLARQYSRPNDRNLISDLYQNGFIPLLRMMQPGFDEGRSPFISYVIRNVESGMGHGLGGTKQSQAALGIQSEDGIVGFKGLLAIKNASKARSIAQQIGPDFRERSGHQKNPGNPLGKYSASFYQLAMEYADALESSNEDRIEAVTNKINQKIEEIEDENTMILGASTGVGQAISTPDRTSSVNIASLDAPAVGSDDPSGMVANIAGSQDEGATNQDRQENVEIITLMLERAMKFDFSSLGDKWKKKAVELGAKGAVKFSGPLNITQLRYTIRTLGESGSNYPGKGNVRSQTSIPREAKGWCSYGEDPELEPIPAPRPAASDSIWRSDWVRKGYPSIGSTEIAAEMTREVLEFEKLNIPTARSMKTKAGGKEEVVSKNAVSNALTAAKIKLMILAEIERDLLGIDESKLTGPLLEDVKHGDKVDREIIAEACDWACSRIDRALAADTKVRHFEVPSSNRWSVAKMRPIESLDYLD